MIPTIGDQVEVLIDDIKYKATITHIEMSFLYAHHLHPIQLELDHAYDHSRQTMYRTNLKDISSLQMS